MNARENIVALWDMAAAGLALLFGISFAFLALGLFVLSIFIPLGCGGGCPAGQVELQLGVVFVDLLVSAVLSGLAFVEIRHRRLKVFSILTVGALVVGFSLTWVLS
ncbi:MAG: hypothetical protein ABR601_07975 [Parasphingopyxis sp.]|nr:hypothetical protein [Sphingomonadales bacterium]